MNLNKFSFLYGNLIAIGLPILPLSFFFIKVEEKDMVYSIEYPIQYPSQ